MKKLIILILAAVMLLASCGGRKGDTEESKNSDSKVTTGTEDTTGTQKPNIPIEEALFVPEGELKEGIDAAVTDYFGLKQTGIEWADPSDLPNTSKSYRCYGIFNGYAVILCHYDPNRPFAYIIEPTTIGESAFYETAYFKLLAYKDGTLCELNEAYREGLITADEIEIVAERHEAVRKYFYPGK